MSKIYRLTDLYFYRMKNETDSLLIIFFRIVTPLLIILMKQFFVHFLLYLSVINDTRYINSYYIIYTFLLCYSVNHLKYEFIYLTEFSIGYLLLERNFSSI